MREVTKRQQDAKEMARCRNKLKSTGYKRFGGYRWGNTNGRG